MDPGRPYHLVLNRATNYIKIVKWVVSGKILERAKLFLHRLKRKRNAVATEEKNKDGVIKLLIVKGKPNRQGRCTTV